MIARSMPLWAARACLLLVSLLMLSSTVTAHELRPTVADITATPDTIEVSMRINLEALITEIGAEHSDSDDAPQATRYNQLRELQPEALQLELQSYLPVLLGQITIKDNNDTTLALTLKSLVVSDVGDIRLPRDSTLILESAREQSTASIAWQWGAKYGAIILRAQPLESTDKQQPDEGFSQYLQAGESSDQIALDSGGKQASGSSFVDYIVIGYEHITPKGLDHILFVIGLFLLAPKFKPIAWQVSMFTIAHTVTLALGITGIILLPASIVEPLIALSITVICIENLLGNAYGKARLAIVFAFGLLHGLGFAGVLSEIGLVSGRFASSLIAFNIGVELGQLSVVFLCFLLVGWWFGKKSWYRNMVTIPASLIIGAIGLFWFLQRVGLIS
ncbi:HupE/UreJ family protein [Granulosicoccus antarcticus]|uniref:HupE / UreJ protein n=1 Tax=Granulosicoccus antarcticus IMCC3135 TaxID=1192854 RepID=A0A2Z2P117_9GAMM|nr:HupE/UreJ family protein [Granulosicoccus antarcticus]ASJ75858.1 hypothetical protein IMCC3135_29035 [Granulosicoccus antarcticus IMCC3135]